MIFALVDEADKRILETETAGLERESDGASLRVIHTGSCRSQEGNESLKAHEPFDSRLSASARFKTSVTLDTK